MKYNGFYFWMFKSPMKKVLAEKYGREYAARGTSCKKAEQEAARLALEAEQTPPQATAR